MVNLRIAVIGCGKRGKGHIRILKEFDDVDLVAVCDPIEEVRSAVCGEYEISDQYGSVEEMLERASLDAVVVATPPHLNAKLSLPCLERGVHTLLEKPPGLSVAEVTELRDAGERSGAKGMVGWNRRFNPLIVEAKKQVTSRGPATQLVGEFHKSITQQLSSGQFAAELMDKLYFETPIHSIDCVRFLADSSPIVEVHSLVRRAISNYRDVHAALVLFENGCVAQLINNYTTSARLERYEVHGRDISAYLEGVSRGEIFIDGEKSAIKGSGGDSTQIQNRFFLDCVKEDRPITLPAANLDEAINTMELAEAVLAGTKD